MAGASATNHDERAAADREKRRVAMSSLAAALVLTGMKLAVGLSTNSLGILSEAAHSALDLVAAGITLWAVRISGRPADPDHTYGHGKFENLSALFETLLLLATCIWIIREALGRLMGGHGAEVDANAWAFGVVLASIVIDISRSRALRRVAEKYQSQALEADALHFATDVWSSCVVLGGLAGVLVANRLGWGWLAKADSVAALGVAGIVIGVSIRLARKSIDDLLDRIPTELRDRVADVAAQVPGVETVTQVRMRRAGPEVFADLTLAVDGAATLEKTHAIADEAEAAVRRVIPRADIVVHAEPAPAERGVIPTVHLVAQRLNLSIHNVHWYEDRGRQSLEMDVEVLESLSLEEAHRQATALEEAIQSALPQLDRIVTHIEPAHELHEAARAPLDLRREVEASLGRFVSDLGLIGNLHDLEVQIAPGGLAVSLHCALDPQTGITAAHELAQQIEFHLRSEVPSIERVMVHVEPPE